MKGKRRKEMSVELNQEIRLWLEKNAEEKLSDFSSALIPGAGEVLGVCLPKLRAYAKKIAKGDWQNYLISAVDHSLEETMLQGMTLGYVKEDFAIMQPYLESFISKISNWSVCDSTCASLKVAKKEPETIWKFLQSYLRSDGEFMIRFGVVMLLDHYIVADYIDRVLDNMNHIHHEGYYVKMAVAWNLSVCYIKFPQQIIKLLKDNELDDWTYNKSIQKMLESYRVSAEDKQMLRAMKRK